MKRITLLLVGGIGGTGVIAEPTANLPPAAMVAHIQQTTPSARAAGRLTAERILL